MAESQGMHRNSLTDEERLDRIRVGAILKTLRTIRGFSPDGFADEVGRARPFMANIEAGRKQLPPDLIPVVAEVLGVPEIMFAKAATLRVRDVA